MAGLFLSAIIAISAIAIEVSRLTDTATEVQVAADASALAAIQSFMKTKDTGTATDAAHAVAARNRSDGRDLEPDDVDITFGSYTVSGGFVAGGTPINAAHANVTLEHVKYLMASVFGRGTETTVTKVAVAAYQAQGAGQPTAPIAICDCALRSYTEGQECSKTGSTFTQSPTPAQNSCWTASASGARDWLPPECGGGDAPFITVGDSITLMNGQMTSTLQAFQACVDAGGKDLGVHDYVIPVVHCADPPCSIGGCNHSAPIVGFATIHIAHSSDIRPQGNKGIDFSQVCNSTPRGKGGPGGAPNFGSGNARLVDSGNGDT